ncbi:unnamed protein product [Sympodiomycopsis kandeliae]
MWPYLGLCLSAGLLLVLAAPPAGKSVGPLSRDHSDSVTGSKYAAEELGLSNAEFEAIFANRQSLRLFQSKSDCFLEAASRVKAICQQGLENDDPNHKIRFAIALTKCELATARLKAPLECEGISLKSSKGGERLENSKVGSESYDTHFSLTTCVEALSRSSQFWSTYSGYIREASQLCLALNEAVEVNFAKDVYRNITMEKQAILKFIKTNAEMGVRKSEAEARKNQKHLEDLQRVYNSILTVLEASFTGVLFDFVQSRAKLTLR